MENRAMENQAKKPLMTDLERLQLAAKLDKELDKFIESLPERARPTGPMDENWLEEFDNHPFFMKKIPEPGDKLHPLYEGLQQLKYDPNENTTDELAVSYKDDGNFSFKHKKYRLAVIAYTEGIRAKSEDKTVEATLYNNRSAAHYYLKNYRSSLRDAESALKLNPEYLKASIRAAHCCFHTEKYDQAITYCDKILDKGENEEILELRKSSAIAKKGKDRDARKKQVAARKKVQDEIKLLEAFKTRGITVEGDLEPKFLELSDHRVHLDADTLIWPVVLIYPEYKTIDFVQQFPENATFEEQMKIVFDEKPNWDVRNEYNVSSIAIYFEHSEKLHFKRVKKSQKLGDVLKDPKFIISGGAPWFMILVKGSQAEEEFRNLYKFSPKNKK